MSWVGLVAANGWSHSHCLLVCTSLGATLGMRPDTFCGQASLGDISATWLSRRDPVGFPPHPRGWLSIIDYRLSLIDREGFQFSGRKKPSRIDDRPAHADRAYCKARANQQINLSLSKFLLSLQPVNTASFFQSTTDPRGDRKSVAISPRHMNKNGMNAEVNWLKRGKCSRQRLGEPSKEMAGHL